MMAPNITLTSCRFLGILYILEVNFEKKKKLAWLEDLLELLNISLSICLSLRLYDQACPCDNSGSIFQIFLKLGWNILWVNISDKFDNGYCSSLNTLWCCYNTVNFLTNIHKRHPIAHSLGWGMGCLLWIQHLIDILSQFLQLFMQYLIILDHIITTLDCVCIIDQKVT